jgi:AcrR family transcriptional regulator
VTKGEKTRQLIVERAVPLFNTRGFAGASMSDLLHATGLEKGGIYNHFDSKEAIALAAFDHAVGLVRGLFREALAGREGAIERLDAIVGVYANLADGSLLPGGCPILNTAVEADDTLPALRDRARAAMGDCLRVIGATVKEGIHRGELRPETDPRTVATVVAATLEGAIVLTRLYEDGDYMRRATDHLREYFATLEVANVGK